ncbi:MAG: DUF5674 family protein [Candidatus Eisenbacteria bacterium]
MGAIVIVRTPVTRAGLRDYLLDDTLVKAVVDCGRGVMAVGGDLHADEESALLRANSRDLPRSRGGLRLLPLARTSINRMARARPVLHRLRDGGSPGSRAAARLGGGDNSYVSRARVTLAA